MEKAEFLKAMSQIQSKGKSELGAAVMEKYDQCVTPYLNMINQLGMEIERLTAENKKLTSVTPPAQNRKTRREAARKKE